MPSSGACSTSTCTATSTAGAFSTAPAFAVGGVTAAALLAALSPDFAQAQQVPPTDPRLKTEPRRVRLAAGLWQGARLPGAPRRAKPAKLPAVLVVHENRGLNPHIEDIARRLALDGFIAFAPDALFPLGGYPGDEDKARELFAKLDQAKTREDFVAAADFLQRVPGGNGKLGVIGFCCGGGIANFLATRVPDLRAAVPFYGGAPPPRRRRRSGGAPAPLRRERRAHQRRPGRPTRPPSRPPA